ncbi:MAG: HipA domain-containing protein [Alphaproteobacteria bacterium]|jgi:serine/threonine-protein kinase HipA|nr:HipA domain-containing protein [Alphaproteobacteria bacterium]MDP7222659.1 HipA domain-containing protein [Alphaproteobacteria bacterium]
MSNVKEVFDSATEVGETCSVCWYGQVFGYINVTQDDVRWAGYVSDDVEELFNEIFPIREDGMPHFIANIGPESIIFNIIGDGNRRDYIEGGLRFLSNLTISPAGPHDKPVALDCLQGSLDEFTAEDGFFTGDLKCRIPKSFDEEELGEEVSEYWTNRHLPRFSGAEIKMPVTLDEDGGLTLANSTSFTHILKFPNDGRKAGWGLNEWMCMELSAAAGLPTASHALVNLGEGIPPAYLVERFDINDTPKSIESAPLSLKDAFTKASHAPETPESRLLLQDFCTLAGLDPHQFGGKTNGSMEKIAKTVGEYSTNPDSDLENLYKRTIVSWAVNDSDMHRKNISMMFEFDPQNAVKSCEMTPAYDITSEVHQYDDKHDMCISLSGKRRNLNQKAFVKFGTTIGLTQERAEEILNDTVKAMSQRAVEISNSLSDDIRNDPMCAYTADRITSFVVGKAKRLGIQTPEWDDVKRDKSLSDDPGNNGRGIGARGYGLS